LNHTFIKICKPQPLKNLKAIKTNRGDNLNHILVTGGAGFIGSHVCEALLKQGKNVICIDDLNSYYDPKFKKENLDILKKHNKFKFVKGDIRKAKLLDQIFKKNKIEKIIHLAARAGVRPSVEHPLLYESVDIKGTINLLELAHKYKIKQFIFGSSSSVYGINKKIPFAESDKVDKPISPYAACKASGELFCYTYHHLYKIPITILRFFTVYGPRGRPDMAVYRFTESISKGEPINVYGNGKSRRDYTYVSDTVSGIINALNKQVDFEIFDLGESRTVELTYLISLIEKNLGKKAKINKMPTQPGDVPITYANISKAKRMLGYNPKTSIEKGIKEFVEWYTQNRAR
jgi:UDP-glucuronate 4-epimerase